MLALGDDFDGALEREDALDHFLGDREQRRVAVVGLPADRDRDDDDRHDDEALERVGLGEVRRALREPQVPLGERAQRRLGRCGL